jgi:hypothetical protein
MAGNVTSVTSAEETVADAQQTGAAHSRPRSRPFQVYWSVVAGHGLYSRPRRVVGRQHVALPRTHEVKAWYGPRVHALREAWSRREVDRALDEADIKLAGAPEERASAIMQALYTELEM